MVLVSPFLSAMLHSIQLTALFGIFQLIHTAIPNPNFNFSVWTPWSSCSASCGRGERSRHRVCNPPLGLCVGATLEHELCMTKFCPSYLTWPRIHFSGSLVADVSTVNNARCRYENKFFTPSQLSKRLIGVTKTVKSHTAEYTKSNSNWNADGSGHIYFQDTKITSICTKPAFCSRRERIVGKTLREITPAVMADLDTDWQFASEIWGLTIHIEGILIASYMTSSTQTMKTRSKTDAKKGYISGAMGRYKSKLTNIKWFDSHYKAMFKDSEQLSIIFVYDMYNHYSLEGRISGTIGLTSEDDPIPTMATRVLRSHDWSVGLSPFYVHEESKFITMDLSFGMSSNKYGQFKARKNIDLGLWLPKKTYCKHFWNPEHCAHSYKPMQHVTHYITHGGEISRRIRDDNKWYIIRGGVIDVSLKNLREDEIALLRTNRLMLLQKDAKSFSTIALMEPKHGAHTGVTESILHRLDPGDVSPNTIFVSVFGKPGIGLQVDLKQMKNNLANTDCGRPSCNRTLGVPVGALSIQHPTGTKFADMFGLVKYQLHAVRDPGNVRGCGLDGQVYPLEIFLRYSEKRKTITIMHGDTHLMNRSPKYIYQVSSLSMAVLIFNNIPEDECPTWHEVKDIFILYYNMFPVMWKNGIIDLHSYTDIRSKVRILKMSMFDLDIKDPRYMPVTRDLSYGKKRMIWNWIKCGMEKGENKEKGKVLDKITMENIKSQLEDLKRDIHAALMIELASIPPYMTAWLSLKAEFGRNKEVADILRAIMTEEMLHMTLAANLLNAIGGNVNLTTFNNIPQYPTPLGFGLSYDLDPNRLIPLERMSIGLVNDVFSEIERPSDDKEKKIFFQVGTILKMTLFSGEGESHHESLNFRRFMSEYSHITANDTHVGGKRRERFQKYDENETKNVTRSWHTLKEFATDKSSQLREIRTVGGLYGDIALRLTKLEAHVRLITLKERNRGQRNLSFPKGTLFTGDVDKQLNNSNWYSTVPDDIVQHIVKEVSSTMGEFGKTEKIADKIEKDPLFENEESSPRSSRKFETRNEEKRIQFQPQLFAVTDLQSALKAIIEIVYQGEGGSTCTPYVAIDGRDSREISHFFRFQEIVHGKKLIKVDKRNRHPGDKCLNLTSACTDPKMNWDFCYSGDTISFHEDGVWPILHSADDDMYENTTAVYKLNKQFNLAYTRLLFCLEDSFNGRPDSMKSCMSSMYDLTIIGRRLVSTPFDTTQVSFRENLGKYALNGAPTWVFQRDIDYRQGLPILF